MRTVLLAASELDDDMLDILLLSEEGDELDTPIKAGTCTHSIDSLVFNEEHELSLHEINTITSMLNTQFDYIGEEVGASLKDVY